MTELKILDDMTHDRIIKSMMIHYPKFNLLYYLEYCKMKNIEPISIKKWTTGYTDNKNLIIDYGESEEREKEKESIQENLNKLLNSDACKDEQKLNYYDVVNSFNL